MSTKQTKYEDMTGLFELIIMDAVPIVATSATAGLIGGSLRAMRLTGSSPMVGGGMRWGIAFGIVYELLYNATNFKNYLTTGRPDSAKNDKTWAVHQKFDIGYHGSLFAPTMFVATWIGQSRNAGWSGRGMLAAAGGSLLAASVVNYTAQYVVDTFSEWNKTS